jgi:exodeoxyribonuclease V alpha subunit
MKSAAASQTQEVLAGLVERVTYHNPENGFCVPAPRRADIETL